MTTSSEEQAVPKTTSRRFLVGYFIKPGRNVINKHSFNSAKGKYFEGRSGKNVDVNKATKLFKMVKTMFLF